ncbi:tetratricopeptide repeat protein [Paracidobacterium acidisoli]|uniref:Tetratricopeptide repeat protein n=1 Tax=Paracidobacterium acidisoli TaxID=2303751 RepID=A0A372IUN4_9BACT|nr:tetratricopeptide repeat protein [Paracidobacterium acidisoli]MBT9330102.1 tetratricopeptide repeat protein [Paracidobacterium acidisoli]
MFRSSSIILFLSIASLAVYGQNSGTSIASIESLIRSQQYEPALQQIRSGLRAQPGDFRLWTLEGIVFSMEGNRPSALDAFGHALKISPEYPAALRGEVQLLYAAQDTRAIPLLEKILKTDPEDKTAHEMLGSLERKQGNCKAAVEQFRLSAGAVEAHPDSLGAYGDCLVKTGQTDTAVGVFQKLSALLPGQTWPKYDLAILLVETKQNDAAVQIIEPLLASSPSDPDILSLASEAYEAAGNTPKAVQLLRQAIVLDPANPNDYLNFASLCLSHSSWQVGIDMLNIGLQRIHGNSSLYISRGLLYAQIAQYEKAEADFNTAEQLDSAQSLSAYAIDLAEMQQNKGSKALLRIRAQLKAHPESPWLHYVLARLLDTEGPGATAATSAEAIQSARQAVKLKPDFIEARDLLASLYMNAGNYDQAITECRQTLQFDPSDESAIYHLLIALRRSANGSQKEEVQTLVKRLSALQQSSLHKEIERNRYKLVEQKTAPAQ